MSRDTVVSKRYAKALFELAAEKSVVSEVEEQLKLIAQTIEANPELTHFLNFPNIDLAKKISVLKDAFKGNLSDIVYNTIGLMLEKGRQDLLGDLHNDYVKLSNEALGLADATVYSAKPLSDKESEQVAAQFSKLLNKKIRIEQVVEPKLIGGIQVRIGDRLYDGSIAGKLSKMEQLLKQTQAM